MRTAKIYSGKPSSWEEQTDNSQCLLYSRSNYSTGQVVRCNTQFGRKPITDTNLVKISQLLLQYDQEQEKNFSLFEVTYLQKLLQKTGKTWQALG